MVSSLCIFGSFLSLHFFFYVRLLFFVCTHFFISILPFCVPLYVPPFFVFPFFVPLFFALSFSRPVSSFLLFALPFLPLLFSFNLSPFPLFSLLISVSRLFVFYLFIYFATLPLLILVPLLPSHPVPFPLVPPCPVSVSCGSSGSGGFRESALPGAAAAAGRRWCAGAGPGRGRGRAEAARKFQPPCRESPAAPGKPPRGTGLLLP